MHTQFHEERHGCLEREHRLLFEGPETAPNVDIKAESPDAPKNPEQKLQHVENAGDRMRNRIQQAEGAVPKLQAKADQAKNDVTKAAKVEGITIEGSGIVDQLEPVETPPEPLPIPVKREELKPLDPEATAAQDIENAAEELGAAGLQKPNVTEPQPNAPLPSQPKSAPASQPSSAPTSAEKASETKLTQEQIQNLQNDLTKKVSALGTQVEQEVGEDMKANQTLLVQMKKDVGSLNKFISHNGKYVGPESVSKAQETIEKSTQKIQELETKIQEAKSKPKGPEETSNASKKTPTTYAEKFEQEMDQAMKEGEKNPLAYLKGIGALFQYIQRSLNGTIDDPLAAPSGPSGTPNAGPSPEQLKQKESAVALRKEIKEKGGYKNLEDDVTVKKNELTPKFAYLSAQEHNLAGREGELKTSVDTVQRRLTQEPPPTNKDAMQQNLTQLEADLKSIQAQLEGVRKQITPLEQQNIAFQKKLGDMKKLSEQATQTTETIAKGIGQTRFVLEGLKTQPGMDDAGKIGTLLGNFTVRVDPLTKVDIKLEVGGGAGAEQLRDTAQKLLGKTPGYEELGIDANGSITNTEKFMGILQEFQQKLEKKGGEETGKREKAKQQGKEYLSEKNAQESSTGSFKITSSTHEAAFTFNVATGAWQWNRNGALVDVPQDPFEGGSTEETYLNDIAKDLQKKTV